MVATVADPLLVRVAGLLGVDDFANQTWRARAACRGQDAAAWFPERGASNHAQIRTCQSCPVREPCLQFALDNHECFGLWGGLSERRRRRARERGLTAGELLADLERQGR